MYQCARVLSRALGICAKKALASIGKGFMFRCAAIAPARAGNQAGEAAADQSAEHKHRQIPEHVHRAEDEDRCQNLTDVVADGADHRQQPEPFQRHMAVEQCTDGIAEQASCKTEQQHKHLPRKNTAEEDSHEQHHERIFWPELIECHQSDDIRQPQLDTGNGGQRRDLRFDNEDDESERRQKLPDGSAAERVTKWLVIGAVSFLSGLTGGGIEGASIRIAVRKTDAEFVRQTNNRRRPMGVYPLVDTDLVGTVSLDYRNALRRNANSILRAGLTDREKLNLLNLGKRKRCRAASPSR